MSQEVFSLASLGIDESVLSVVPSGGEAFGASVFIGPWEAFMGQMFMTLTDYVLHNQDNENPAPVPDIRIQRGDYYSHYYRDYAASLDAYAKLTDNEYKPQSVWVMYMDTVKLVGLDDEAKKRIQDGFGEKIVLDIRTVAPRKGSGAYPAKNRHQYTMIALPSVVASVADAFGHERAVWSVDELCEPDLAFTDEEFAVQFGELTGEYEESIWWRKRAALWESLGEPDARRQAVQGSLTASGKPNALATKSEILNKCLMLTQGQWGRPIWCAVTLVPDPLPEAVTKSGKRLSIPVVTTVFRGETDATEYAQRVGSEEGSPSHPSLPANWVSAGTEEFVKYLKEQSIPKTPPEWVGFVNTHYTDTVELAKEWVEFIQK